MTSSQPLIGTSILLWISAIMRLWGMGKETWIFHECYDWAASSHGQKLISGSILLQYLTAHNHWWKWISTACMITTKTAVLQFARFQCIPKWHELTQWPISYPFPRLLHIYHEKTMVYTSFSVKSPKKHYLNQEEKLNNNYNGAWSEVDVLVRGIPPGRL